MFALPLVAAVILELAPFAGPSQPGSVTGAVKFSVTVLGTPRADVHLRALGVPPGYIASFCTRRVCAPFAVTFALPAGGRETVELQLIQNSTDARPPHAVTVTAGSTHASIAFARGTR